MSIEQNVRERYSTAAQTAQAELCCPVDYDTRLLSCCPPEIVEKDYGCGDPSRLVPRSATRCSISAVAAARSATSLLKLLGNGGWVIGVDMNDDMLALARKYQPEMAQRLGSDRVRFVKGYIRDLALDLGATEDYLRAHAMQTAPDPEDSRRSRMNSAGRVR